MVPYSLFSKSCSTEYTQIGTVQKPPYCICLHYCYFPWFYMSCTYIMFHCYVLGTTCIALLAYCHDIASYTDTKVVHLGLHFAANPLTCTTFGSQNWSRRTNFGQDFFYDTTLMCICMYPAINASKHYVTPANEAMVFIYVPKTVYTLYRILRRKTA